MKRKVLDMLARVFRFHPDVVLCNIAEGTHEDSVTKLADAAITTRYLLVKVGSDANHIAVANAADCPLGVCSDEPSAAEAEADVKLFGCAQSSRIMVPIENISAGDEVYSAAGGKVQDEPLVPGTYYRVGLAMTDGLADEPFEVDPRDPVKYIVM